MKKTIGSIAQFAVSRRIKDPVIITILKMFYGMKLNNTKKFPIMNIFGDKVISEVTEKGFVEYMFGKGKCNFNKPSKEYKTLILCAGRRFGKSTIQELVQAYEFSKGKPNRLSIRYTGAMVNVNLSMAERSLDKAYRFLDVKDMICNKRNKLCLSYSRKSKPEHDLELVATGGNANSLRCYGIDTLSMDEVAFNEKADDAVSFLFPCTNGRKVLVSSPFGVDNKFYNVYKTAQKSRWEDTLVFKCYSAMATHPQFDSKMLREEFERDPVRFMGEFGSEFIG